MKRRALLSTVLATSISLSGCLDGLGGSQDERLVELDASNLSDTPVSLDLQVYSTDETLLYEHSDTWPARHGFGLEDIEDSIGRLELSVNDRESIQHDYDPPYDDSCEEPNLHIKIEAANVDFDYYCQS